MTSTAQPVLGETDVEVHAVDPHVHEVLVLEAAFGEGRCSSCHWVVSRVITDADSPAADPKNPSSAGAKSPLDMPCRYSSGSTSVTFGDLRAHGGTIELNRIRSPVSDRSDGRSPAGPDLDPPRPGRDRPRLGVAVADHQPLPALVDLPPAPRRTRRPRPRARPRASAGRPPGDLIQRQRISAAAVVISYYFQHRRSFLAGVAAPAFLLVNEEGTPRPRTGGRSTGSGRISSRGRPAPCGPLDRRYGRADCELHATGRAPQQGSTRDRSLSDALIPSHA